MLNGTPIFLRGGCDDQHYPHTVCPPAETDFYRRRLRQARNYGFNYTNSCVEIYTREYLDAADEVGLLVCQEMPFLLRDELASYPDGLPAERTAFFHRELANSIRANRNHPAARYLLAAMLRYLAADTLLPAPRIEPDALPVTREPEAL